MTNKFFREDLMEFIEMFASKEIQKEIWFEREVNKREDPNEFYCMLFNDFSVEDFVNAPNNYLTEIENKELQKFINILNLYANKYKDEKGFLNFDSNYVFYDLEWENIRQEAQKLYQLLQKGEGIEKLEIIDNWTY